MCVWRVSENEAHVELASQLCVGLQLAVIWTASVAAHKAMTEILIFVGIIARNVWVYDS